MVVVLAATVILCGLVAGRVWSSARSWFSSRQQLVGSFVYRLPPEDTPYMRWIENTKASRPTFSGLLIQDVRTQPLRPWPQMGIDGLYIQMADYQIVDGWILEIPPGGSTTPQRHLFEAGVYYLGGPGHTILQQEGRPPQRVDWKYRSLFSIPLNVRYQHFNDSDRPVRLVAVTSFPYVMNSTDSVPFVFENCFEFRDRYDGEPDFATRSGRAQKNRTEANLLDDAVVSELDDHEVRGPGATNMHWSMAGNTMVDLHASEIPARIYKRAHRHSSDAFILLLSGEGYSLTWPEGRYEERIRVNWQEGTLFVPPIYWYHQHLNPGAVPARYLAINASMLVRRLGLRFYDQIEQDLPQIAREFDAEVARRSSTATR
ncbi:MAG: ethanolamine ammonia lyase-activating protein [Vicinamibacteria bacterium]|nr:ethanolamine ammonia lyase-activating protein [Vicinamibacteria bacterium]